MVKKIRIDECLDLTIQFEFFFS